MPGPGGGGGGGGGMLEGRRPICPARGARGARGPAADAPRPVDCRRGGEERRATSVTVAADGPLRTAAVDDKTTRRRDPPCSPALRELRYSMRAQLGCLTFCWILAGELTDI